MPKIDYIVAAGVLLGTVSRFLLLRVDYRQYPSYPQGYTIHLTIGAIAAGLGAVTIPAFMNKEYSAITFIALAAQHFREVRNMERESLKKVEESELVKRGEAYIEDIAKKFESRNYVSMLVAFVTTLVIYITESIRIGILGGVATLVLMRVLIRTQRIEQIADVRPARISFRGAYMLVDDIIVMNVGLRKAREKLHNDGIAVMVIPKDDNARVTMSNIGQRQAILHDIVSILGIRRETDEPEFMPLAKRNSDNGNVGIVALAAEPDVECMVEVVKKSPVLETSKRQPLDSYIGRKAAD